MDGKLKARVSMENWGHCLVLPLSYFLTAELEKEIEAVNVYQTPFVSTSKYIWW